MIALWYLANIESFRGVADRFGVSSSTAWHCLYRICRKLLIVNSVHKIISLRNQNGFNAIMDRFHRKTGFPGIVGAIDGSHIPIIAPKENHTSYINRKSFHSVLLQGICDDKQLFMDCYAGEAGSIHDACMFRRSEIGRTLDGLDLPNNGHFLGDSAYPLKIKLLVPFRDNGHLTNIQRNYNTKHSKNRVVIEQAFAFLKGRFRRLKLLEVVRLDLIPLVIISACILHNIAHGAEDFLNDINIYAQIAEEQLMNPENGVNEEVANNALTLAKRNNIANLLLLRN
ncbi:hypothetical protein RI129_011927 [Pyrocoelia pectoralis]|uniref:DDE Tnp4 domain-containing protein n=1 Tax=Pyrocoelia pectoralis TaxID=417401 RepID=A0AAN7UXV6_9COLE